ncbi:MAG: MaoC family dehydratase [Chloroflexi bacterium]|nr:MaoC family dehydratase [Chloroflexota bacterium]
MTPRAIDQIDIGFSARFRKTVSDEDIRKFAEVSGDFNPLHLDQAYAARTFFKERIAHGILVAGLVSAALTKLPGMVVYLSQNMRFLRPVKIGDDIEARVEVTGKVVERSELALKTTCWNQRGEQVLDGEARVKLFDLRPS